MTIEELVDGIRLYEVGGQVIFPLLNPDGSHLGKNITYLIYKEREWDYFYKFGIEHSPLETNNTILPRLLEATKLFVKKMASGKAIKVSADGGSLGRGDL